MNRRSRTFRRSQDEQHASELPDGTLLDDADDALLIDDTDNAVLVDDSP